ncbi:MAG: prepilin-type N-terminal cleavage/methylation domain-containing protein [Rubrivivax sp.]|nr:prepilin-type N-terminal cleavage/methylation domain-containing protein [Rubrivivax sp.]
MIRFRGHRCLQSGSRGVSLIEALVALAVMAFGMLGVVAMQSSMRQNSDIAKQRSEATRLAHQAIESRRTFTVMTNTAGRLAWADLIDQAPQTIVGTNASYVRTATTPDLGSGRSKNLIVDVQWVDRNGALPVGAVGVVDHRQPARAGSRSRHSGLGRDADTSAQGPRCGDSAGGRRPGRWHQHLHAAWRQRVLGVQQRHRIHREELYEPDNLHRRLLATIGWVRELRHRPCATAPGRCRDPNQRSFRTRRGGRRHRSGTTHGGLLQGSATALRRLFLCRTGGSVGRLEVEWPLVPDRRYFVSGHFGR